MSHGINFTPISELLAQHAAMVSHIRQECTSEIAIDPKQFGDDLFVLRFAISARGKKEKAISNFKAAVAWRTENKDLLRGIADGSQLPPNTVEFAKFSIGGPHKTLKTGEPLLILRSGISNAVALMDHMSEEDVYRFMLFIKEAQHAFCDRVSREQNRIVKLITLMDFKDVTWANSADKRFFAAMGRASKDSEKYYPQLQGMTVMLNLPLWMRAVVAIAKPFMSKQSLEKMQFCGGKTLKSPLGDCPVAQKLLDPADVPTFLGGTCQCPGGCVGNVPNDQRTPVMLETAAAKKS